MAIVFSEGFEGGSSGTAITSGNVAYDTINGSPTFDSLTRIAGSLSAKVSPAGGSGVTLKEGFPAAVSHRFFRRYFRINAYPAGSNVITIMRTRTGTTTQAQVVVGATGLVTIRDGNTVVGTSANTVTLNVWFRVEWEVNGTATATQNCRLFFGPDLQSVTPTETLTGAYTGGTFDKIEDGIGTSSYLGSAWVDEVADDDTTWVGPSASGNQVPTANAGTDQSVTSAQAVTLNGTGSSDSDGTIASYAWTQISGTAVTLSDATIAQPTFTAPTVTGSPTTLVFGLVVIDNLSAQSAQDTVTITVNPAAPAAFSEDFEGGSNGATITTSNTAYSTVTSTSTFDTSAVVSGSLSAKFVGTGANTASLTQSLPSAATARYVRRYYRISALPTGGMVLTRFRVNSSGTTTAQVVINSSGLIQIRDGGTSVATSATAITLNTWFRLEWFVDGVTTNTQTLKLFVLGNYNGTMPDETLSGAYTSGSFDRIIDGIGTGLLTGTLWLDGVADSTSAYPGPITGANAAPTANAGPDQTVSGNASVALDGTGSSDSDGVINAYAWSQTSGTSVSLSSTSASQPTFTAPSTGTTLVFKLVAIDDKGAGAADAVSITVNAPPAPAFNESFSTGPNGATLTTSNTTYSAFTGTSVFDNTQSIVGPYSALLASTGTSVFMREIFAVSVTQRYIRAYFRISALPSSGNIITLIRVRLSSTTTGQVVLSSSGTLVLRDTGNVTVATSGNVMPLNTWIRVEWHIDGTTTNTQTMRLYMGNLLNSPSIQTETISGAYTGGAFDRAEEGVGSPSYTGNLWVDEVQDQAATWPGPATGANQPPVVSAGQSQNVLPGVTVTLDGTGSTDFEGPIASYAWSQTSGTSVSLSSTSASQPTFTAPSLANGDTLVFHLVVTDSGGVTSQTGSVSITVQPANEFVLRSGTWQVAAQDLT